MERLFVVLFFVASLTAAILYRKFPGNTKKGIVARFCWFIFFMSFSFIFLSENATLPQNIVLILFSIGGLTYFYFKWNIFKQKAGH
jgi:hypothetical protein